MKAWVLAIACSAIGPSRVLAGITVGNEIETVKIDGLTPGVNGMAFDGVDTNPIVHDRLGWLARRVDIGDSHFLSTVAFSPNTGTSRALALRPGTNTYYAVNHNTNALVSLDLVTGTRTQVGGSLNQSFNHLSLAFAPDGTLWLGTDRNGGELWTVNLTTGAPTLRRTLTFPGSNWGFTALAIDPAGQFFAAAYNFLGPREIFRVNTTTGVLTTATTTPLSPFQTINSFAFDPITGRTFGVVEDRETNPYSFRLAHITGVPEPSAAAMLLAAMTAGVAIRRRPECPRLPASAR